MKNILINIINNIIMINILKKLFNLLIIIKIFQYESTKASIKWLLGLVKQAQMQWAKNIFNYLQVKGHQFQGSQPLKSGKTIVYANHRSQADFFLHNVFLNFQTNFLSRLGVLIVAPVFIVGYRDVWFFNRNNKTNPQKFNEWLDQKFKNSHRPGLLVYPQGHRMQGVFKVDPTKIKTGMFKYAYRRQIPSQIFISFGNQDIFDQKRLHLAFGKTCYYKMSEVIDPKDFGTQIEYIQKIKQRFCQSYDEVYALYQNQLKVKKDPQPSHPIQSKL